MSVVVDWAPGYRSGNAQRVEQIQPSAIGQQFDLGMNPPTPFIPQYNPVVGRNLPAAPALLEKQNNYELNLSFKDNIDLRNLGPAVRRNRRLRGPPPLVGSSTDSGSSWQFPPIIYAPVNFGGNTFNTGNDDQNPTTTTVTETRTTTAPSTNDPATMPGDFPTGLPQPPPAPGLPWHTRPGLPPAREPIYIDWHPPADPEWNNEMRRQVEEAQRRLREIDAPPRRPSIERLQIEGPAGVDYDGPVIEEIDDNLVTPVSRRESFPGVEETPTSDSRFEEPLDVNGVEGMVRVSDGRIEMNVRRDDVITDGILKDFTQVPLAIAVVEGPGKQNNRIGAVLGGVMLSNTAKNIGNNIRSQLDAAREMSSSGVNTRNMATSSTNTDVNTAINLRPGVIIYSLRNRPPQNYQEEPHSPTTQEQLDAQSANDGEYNPQPARKATRKTKEQLKGKAKKQSKGVTKTKK